jgi:hypothetical protein
MSFFASSSDSIVAGLSSHMKTAFSLFGCIVNNNLSGSVPTEIGILRPGYILSL